MLPYTAIKVNFSLISQLSFNIFSLYIFKINAIIIDGAFPEYVPRGSLGASLVDQERRDNSIRGGVAQLVAQVRRSAGPRKELNIVGV